MESKTKNKKTKEAKTNQKTNVIIPKFLLPQNPLVLSVSTTVYRLFYLIFLRLQSFKMEIGSDVTQVGRTNSLPNFLRYTS